MENKKSIRPTTQEIDRTVDQLQTAFSHNLLSELEFDERMSKALSAKEQQELEDLLADLDAPELEKNSYAIMSGFDKNGYFVLGKSYNVKAIMGGCSIDLRQAEFKCHETVMKVTAIMGGIELILPEGFRVIVQGSPILGGISQKVNRNLPPTAPVIKIKATCIMGGIDISNKKNNY